MKTYEVIDQTLRSVSQGESVFPVTGGSIELPDEIAAELLASGQIVKPAKVEDAGPEKPAPVSRKRNTKDSA